MVYPHPFKRDCNKCGKPIRLERGHDMRWRSYEVGTNQYHACPNWQMKTDK